MPVKEEHGSATQIGKSLAPSIIDLVASLRRSIGSATEDSTLAINTPFRSLNEFLGPLREFVVFAGPPGAGKSAMVHQICISSAIKDIPVLLVDFEHYWQFLILRLLSGYFNRTIEEVKTSLMSDSVILPPGLKAMSVWSSRAVTPQDIRLNLLALGADTRPSILAIDSLQKLPAVPGSQPREKTDIWLRELEDIKNRFPVTILCVSELSRGEGGRNYSSPAIYAFKESGDIEYTARQALCILPVQDQKPEDAEDFNVFVTKNTFGRTGKVPAVFSQANFLRWRWEEI